MIPEPEDMKLREDAGNLGLRMHMVTKYSDILFFLEKNTVIF